MPLDAKSRLVLIRVKSKWAEKQLRNLAAEILALQHTIVVERDEKTGVAPHPVTFLFSQSPELKPVPTLPFDVITLDESSGSSTLGRSSWLSSCARHCLLLILAARSDRKVRDRNRARAHPPLLRI